MTIRRALQLSFALLFGALVLAAGSPAGAVDNPDYTAPPPTTVVTTPPSDQPDVTTKPLTVKSAAPVRSQMAITGADVSQTIALGVGLIAVGAVVLVVREAALGRLTSDSGTE